MQSYNRRIGNLCKTSIFGIKPNPHRPVIMMMMRSCFSSEKSDETDKTQDLTKNDEIIEKKAELGGFAKAFAKFSEPQPDYVQPEENHSFAHLIRHSKLIDLGDPEGKVVSGKIFHVVGDDLYIDFGWKFHCVCPRPTKNSRDYVRGALVRIRIKDLELSTKFLGATKDLTILEADCTLTSLISTPMRNVTTV